MSDQDLRDVFGEFLEKEGENIKDLVVLDADLSSSTRTTKFASKFPDRFFNMGIAEQNMLGTSLGFAISGKIPIVSGFSIFTTGRAWEFIRLACHDNLNVKIITTHGGLVGKDGSSHNSLEDISLMAALPNLLVLIPSDTIELKSMLYYAVKYKGPVFIRLPRGSFPRIHQSSYKFSLEKIDVLKEGSDICLIGSGYGACLAYQSVEELEKKLNISIKIINHSCVKPINISEFNKQVKDVKGIITIEEHNIYCGIGAIISRIVSENAPKPMELIGLDTFGQSGNREIVLKKYGLSFDNLLKKVKKLIRRVG